jgi:hypothetical protein
MQGKWRVVETPDYDMAGPGSYILFTENGGEFVLDCLKGSIHGRCEGDAVEFTWDGSDEMEAHSNANLGLLIDAGTIWHERICARGTDWHSSQRGSLKNHCRLCPIDRRQ